MEYGEGAGDDWWGGWGSGMMARGFAGPAKDAGLPRQCRDCALLDGNEHFEKRAESKLKQMGIPDGPSGIKSKRNRKEIST